MTPADTTNAPPAPLSKLAYARHRRALGLPGADESSVRRAVKDRRIPRELVTPNGKIRDAEAADRAWARNTRSDRAPLSGPTAPKPAAPDCRPVLVLDDQAVTVSFPLAPLLAGVRSALRAAGREATPEALRAAVAAVPHEWWWKLAIDDLNGRIDPDVPLDQLRADWERAGWEAAGGAVEDLAEGR